MTRAYCRTCHRTHAPEISLCPTCGAGLVPFPAELDIGAVLPGDIRIVRLLDEGGMGAVFVGVQEALKREVAVKVMRSELSRDPAITRRFLDEGPLLAQLEHPNTVRVLQQGRTPEGLLFLVMELLRGRTLRDLLAAERRLPVHRMLRIAVQICNSLEEAHGKGLVHRDLKPEHVFLQDHPGNPDFVRVFDFGIARRNEEIAEERLTQPGMVFGTITYMSPEQANGDEVDQRADIYSLGVVFHEMLTGDPIFRSANPLAVLMRKLTFEPTPIRVKQPELEVPPALDDLLGRMLASRSQGRPATMSEVRDVLLALIDEPVREAVVASGLAPASAASAETERTRVGTRPVLAPRFELPECLGRAAEKDQALDFLNGFVRTGEPRVLLVDGGTGVGKSKLVGWLQQRAAGYGDVRISRGVFSRFNTTVSLQAVKDAVRSLLESDEASSVAPLVHPSVKLSTGLRRWDITDTDLALILSELMYPGQAGATSLAQLGQERYWESAYLALMTPLREIGARTRLVLILDDVQWADTRSIEFLQILLDAMRARSVNLSLVLVVNTEEAEDRDAFSGLLVWMLRHLSSITRKISLQPLSGRDFDDFVNAVAPLDKASRAELFRMSRGNPFFAIELLQFLHNENELVRVDQHFSFCDAASRLSTVPLTLKDIVQRKFARFRVHSRQAEEGMVVLEHVALFGDPLPVDLLEAALEADATAERVRAHLDDALDALTEQRLLKLETRAGKELLEPYHPIVTLYLQAEHGRARRGRRIHKAFAGVLEARLARRDPYLIERVGYHHRHAGDGARALPFYREAALGWRARHEYERAKACLEVWLALGEGLDLLDDGAWSEILTQLAQIQTVCGELPTAEQTWRRVLARCSAASADPAYGRALLGLAEIRAHSDAVVDDDLRQAARFFRRHGHRRDLATALARQADRRMESGKVALATRLFDAAERIFEAEGATDELTALYNRRGLACLHAGQVDRAQAFFERGLHIQEAANNPVELARACNNIGIALLQQGLPDEAERFLRDGLERLGDVHFPMGRASLILNLGLTRNLQRDLPGSLQYLDEALALANEAQEIEAAVNLPVHGWSTTALIGDLYLRKGDASQARRYLERAYHLAGRLHLRTTYVAEVLQMLAHLYEKEGNAASAAQALAEAEQIYGASRNVSGRSQVGDKIKRLTGQYPAGGAEAP